MTDYKNSKLVIDSANAKPGSVGWRSPSNLAIIKYWGKYGAQLPKNPSISFTLKNAYTETWLEYKPKTGNYNQISLNLFFQNQPNEAFRSKVLGFMESIIDVFPFLRQLEWTIQTRNSFPHSAGIASSASAMSALALCLCSMEKQLFGSLNNQEVFYQKASYIARLGSGSACRSVYPKLAVWGETGAIPEASNLYAIPYTAAHSVFQSFHDDILLISQKEKSVSSRAGHGLMEGNIYADNRYTQAKQRTTELNNILQNGDIEAFGRIAESEAMTLHALMMASNPPYILLQPNTITAIEKVRDFRNTKKTPLYFSLDAGPNLHLLYPDSAKDTVKKFIREELAPLCQNNQWIEDEAGEGPEPL
ncbi:MAG: diphosphomevalonate decarboxylase [Saprospiraceae bacterium]|jgi:diphosphomevalonate decarboxylase|nr:diphosphomevalonate decarboxylase [Saprospiraceae bacterium]HRD79591.1 diphosphomevalonate decarboxylase [Saprospiraceae bacterium]